MSACSEFVRGAQNARQRDCGGFVRHLKNNKVRFGKMPKPAGKMPTLPGNVNFGAFLRELRCLLFQSMFDRVFFCHTMFQSVLANVLGNFH